MPGLSRQISRKPGYRLSLLVAVALLSAANPAVAARDKPSRAAPITWPALPDPPLFGYEYTLKSQADAGVVDTRGWLQRMVTNGRDQTRDPILEKPVALAARNGRIMVADSMLKMIVVFDIPRRRVYPFGVRDDAGRLAMPVAIAIDGRMRAYVVDAKARRVHVYDDMGLYLHSIGSPETLERPTGVAVDAKGESIYVVDRSSDLLNTPKVVCFDARGAIKRTIGSFGDGQGQLNIPLKVAVDANDQLYVLDAGNFRIQVFDREGRFLRMFGSVGAAAGALSRPRGLAVGDYVYVADAAFGNVQIFDKQGNMMLFVGSLAKDTGKHSAGEYSLISDVAVDETGRIYIADQYFRKIEIIKPIGKPARFE